MTRKRTRDISDAALEQSADRCKGCPWKNNPASNKEVCKACNGDLNPPTKLPPHFGTMRPATSAKQQLANDFMEFFEGQGVKFVDVTPRKADAPRRSGIYTRPTHESEVEAIRKLITALGGRFNLFSQGHRLHGSAGIPDAYCHGAFRMPVPGGVHIMRLRFWVEVKAGRDKLRTHQMAFKDTEEECEGKVVVGGIDEVIGYFRFLGANIP